MTMHAPTTLAFLSMPGGWEWLIVLAIGLLIFGRRLPDVGRSIGKTVVEFRKGIREVEDDIKSADSKPAAKPTDTGDTQPVLPSETAVEGDPRTIPAGSMQPEPAPKPE